MSEFKGTKGKWYSKYSKTDEGFKINSGIDLVCITRCIQREDEANALLISKAPEMLQELQETLKDLLCIQGSIYDSSRIDARWEGVYDIIQKQIDRKKELIKQATEI